MADTVIFHAMPSDSETVLVSFGAKGGGHGQFHFFKTLQPLPGLTKLLVRDPAGHWYNDGLPGVADTIEEATEAIRLELDKLNAGRVITSGSSMGGYAAILFGCTLGAERALALAPQTLLDKALRHAPPSGVALEVPDLEPVIREHPGTEIDLVAGWDDPLDIFNAMRVAHLPSVRVLALRNGVHAFVEDLYRDEKLIPMIVDLVDGRVPQDCDVNPQLDRDLQQRFADTAYAVPRRDWETVAERIGPVADRHPEWSGPNFEYGRALVQLGNWEAAELRLDRAIQAHPRRGEAHLLLARCLMRLERTSEGRAAAHRAAELDPKFSEAAEELIL